MTYKLTGAGKGWSKGLKFAQREICSICGKEFYCAPIYKKRSKNSGRFCSVKCKGIWQSKMYAIKFKKIREKKLKQKNARKKLAEKKLQSIKLTTCKFCGKQSKKMFCDMTCYKKFRKKNIGSTLMDKICEKCGKKIKVTPSQHNAGYGKYCSISCSTNYRILYKKHTVYGNCKGGKRPDLNNQYFRSRWEANYARYLNFLIRCKQIKKWEYEIDTFFFENIKRGINSYTPDFKIYNTNGTIEYHEIKGYLNNQSKTKLNRMAKYYPDKKIIVIGHKEYKALYNKLKKIIPHWEIGTKKDY